MERSGKRPTASGVAAITGLSRKEVARLHDSDPEELLSAVQHRNRAIRVLSGWCNDPEFCADELPRVLPLDTKKGGFVELVKRYSGDMTPAAMLGMLEMAGSVRQTADGVELVNSAYIPMATPVERLNILGTDVGELISTIGHNIEAEADARWFQRKVSAHRIKAADIEAFKVYSAARSQALLEEYDQWLSERELPLDAPETDDVNYVAVGIYFHTIDSDEEVNHD